MKIYKKWNAVKLMTGVLAAMWLVCLLTRTVRPVPSRRWDHADIAAITNRNLIAAASQGGPDVLADVDHVGRGLQSASDAAAHRVLLLTYARGGSSLLGDAMNQNPDVFYWFEPLLAIFEEVFGKRQGIVVDESDEEFFKKKLPLGISEEILAAVQHIFTCNFDNLSSEYFTHRFSISPSWKKSLKMVPFRSCMTANSKRSPPGRRKSMFLPSSRHVDDLMIRRRSGDIMVHKVQGSDQFSNHAPFQYVGDFDAGSEDDPLANIVMRFYRRKPHSDNVRICRRFLTRECKASSIRAIKTIRLRMSHVELLLQKDPDLRIIHQIRDPRGILSSRWKASRVPDESVLQRKASSLCRQIRQDTKKRIELQRKYPMKLLQIRYEDLASKQNETLRTIYTFLGLDVPNVVGDWLYSNTHARKNNGVVGTSRKNSTQTASDWRGYLSAQKITTITDLCNDVLRMYNYSL